MGVCVGKSKSKLRLGIGLLATNPVRPRQTVKRARGFSQHKKKKRKKMPKKKRETGAQRRGDRLIGLGSFDSRGWCKICISNCQKQPQKKKPKGGRYVKLHGQKDVPQSLFSFLRFPISVVYVSNLNFNFKRLEATDSDSYLPSAIRGGGKHLHRVHKCLKSCQRKCFT